MRYGTHIFRRRQESHDDLVSNGPHGLSVIGSAVNKKAKTLVPSLSSTSPLANTSHIAIYTRGYRATNYALIHIFEFSENIYEQPSHIHHNNEREPISHVHENTSMVDCDCARVAIVQRIDIDNIVRLGHHAKY